MLLSARILSNLTNVNSYDLGQAMTFTEGDTVTVYLQLIDLNKDTGNKPLSGRRYVPAAGATLSVVMKSNNSAKTITKVATAPFATDLSIWSFNLLPADLAKGTLSLQLTLTQSTVATYGRADAALLVEPATASFV